MQTNTLVQTLNPISQDLLCDLSLDLWNVRRSPCSNYHWFGEVSMHSLLMCWLVSILCSWIDWVVQSPSRIKCSTLKYILPRFLQGKVFQYHIYHTWPQEQLWFELDSRYVVDLFIFLGGSLNHLSIKIIIRNNFLVLI